jgi:hypothetical protein
VIQVEGVEETGDEEEDGCCGFDDALKTKKFT